MLLSFLMIVRISSGEISLVEGGIRLGEVGLLRILSVTALICAVSEGLPGLRAIWCMLESCIARVSALSTSEYAKVLFC